MNQNNKNELLTINVNEIQAAMSGLHPTPRRRRPKTSNKGGTSRPRPDRRGVKKSKASPTQSQSKSDKSRPARRGSAKSRGRPAAQARGKNPAPSRESTLIDLENTKLHQDFLVVFHAGTCLVLDAATKSGTRSSELYSKVPYDRLASEYYRGETGDFPFHVLRFFKKEKRWVTSPQRFPLSPEGAPNKKLGLVELRRAPSALYIFKPVEAAARSVGLLEVCDRRYTQYRTYPLGVFHDLYYHEHQMFLELAKHEQGFTPKPVPVRKAAELIEVPAASVPQKVTEAAELLEVPQESPAKFSIPVRLMEVCEESGEVSDPWEDEWEIPADSLDEAQQYATLVIDENDTEFIGVVEGKRVVGHVIKETTVS